MAEGIRVLIIDAHDEYRRLLREHISIEWPRARVVEHDGDSTRRLPQGFSTAAFDVVLLAQEPVSGQSGLEWLRDFQSRPGFPPVVFLTRSGEEGAALKALKAGAMDYLEKPKIPHDLLIHTLQEARRRHRRMLARLRAVRVADEISRFGEVRIRGYRCVERIATSTIAALYLAERQQDGVRLVLKVLRQVPDVAEGKAAFERFIQEYEVISRIEHPNIVRIFDLGIADDHAYIAMEHFPVGDLRGPIRSGMTLEQARSYLRQIAVALQEIHSVGVLHRDLKPANVMRRADGSIALIDFGLAKQLALEADLTGTGEIFGTPYYMSPEQGHANPVDERSDLYSLGVIYYEMLTGEKPFVAGSPMAVIYKHSHAQLPRLPPALAAQQPLVDRLLAKEPEARFQSAEELLEALDSAATEDEERGTAPYRL